jgi:hypothetical protein
MAFPGPTPPFNNPPIQPYFFKPSQFIISNIVLGQTTTVTTVLPNNYVVGQQIRLLIPSGYGCTQLDEVKGFISSILSTTDFVTTIDSSQNVNAFISSPPNVINYPQVIAIGDINFGISNPNGTVLSTVTIPGAFVNTSPVRNP